VRSLEVKPFAYSEDLSCLWSRKESISWFSGPHLLVMSKYFTAIGSELSPKASCLKWVTLIRKVAVQWRFYQGFVENQSSIYAFPAASRHACVTFQLSFVYCNRSDFLLVENDLELENHRKVSKQTFRTNAMNSVLKIFFLPGILAVYASTGCMYSGFTSCPRCSFADIVRSDSTCQASRAEI
jgi:hypothetical protein